jgi:hypothetical protein
MRKWWMTPLQVPSNPLATHLLRGPIARRLRWTWPAPAGLGNTETMLRKEKPWCRFPWQPLYLQHIYLKVLVKLIVNHSAVNKKNISGVLRVFLILLNCTTVHLPVCRLYSQTMWVIITFKWSDTVGWTVLQLSPSMATLMEKESEVSILFAFPEEKVSW